MGRLTSSAATTTCPPTPAALPPARTHAPAAAARSSALAAQVPRGTARQRITLASVRATMSESTATHIGYAFARPCPSESGLNPGAGMHVQFRSESTPTPVSLEGPRAFLSRPQA